MYLLRDLLQNLTVVHVHGREDVIVTGVESDSRSIKPQNVFVAIKGAEFDGHDFIAKTVESGATVVVGERQRKDVDLGSIEHAVSYVQVSDTRHAYAHLLLKTMPHILSAFNDITFVGVTGTNGKTTVATISEQLYSSWGMQTALIGTTGIKYHNRSGYVAEITSTHTTPDVKKLYELIGEMHSNGVGRIIMEVSSHALNQSRIHAIPFHTAVFTNLTHDHLDYHGSMERYAKSKKMLFDSLAEDAFAVVNGDDDWTPFLTRECKGQVVRVGRGQLNDVCIMQEQGSTQSSMFSLIAPSMIHNSALSFFGGSPTPQFTIPLIGRFNVLNAALCIVSAMLDGMPLTEIREKIQHVKPPHGRMETVKIPSGSLAVVDYAHTPDALEQVLRTLNEIMEPPQRLHVVFGCGGNRDVAKRPDMGYIAGTLADEVWVTSDNPRNEDPMAIIDAILEGCHRSGNRNIHHYIDRREAVEHAISMAEPGDVILVAGKGHEEYQIIGTEKIPFSDFDVIQSISSVRS